MNPGSWLIRIAAIATLVALVAGVRWSRGHAPSERLFRRAYDTMTAMLVFASIALFTAILRHDFRYEYVVHYSSRDLPMLYLISAFWGGQEGTYLLWALFGAVLGYWLLYKESWQRPLVMTTYLGTVALLNLLMLHPNADPFRLGATVPADGNGLNPLLQDPWMATHPPVVFLGYAALTIPAVLAMVGIWKRDETRWIIPGLRFALFGFITLGVGIALGAFWAYKVLGWGGFWGWDPVENASLIPWLMVTALLHGFIVQQMTGALRLTNPLLAMGCYLTVIYATFLTRSGVLADFSVHSFPKGTVYSWLLSGMTAVTAVSVWTILRRKRERTPTISSAFAWPLVLTGTLVLFVISAFLVLLGTSWPILSGWFGNPGTPNAGFYNQVNLPIYVLLVLLLGIGPFLTWAPVPIRRSLQRLAPSAAVAAVITIVAYALGGRGIGQLLLFFGGIFTVVSNLIRFAHVAPHRFLTTGAAVAHIGFGMMIMGVVASESWDTSERARLPQGQAVEVLDRTITYHGFIAGSEPKDRYALEVGSLAGGASHSGAIRTEMTCFTLPNGQLFRKPAILRRLTGDLYISPEEINSHAGTEALELPKGTPVDWHGSTLTFERFGMGGGDHEEMSVSALVQLARDGQTESLVLPLRMYGGKMQGVAVQSQLATELSFTLGGMSVEQGVIRVGAEDASAPGAGYMLVEASKKPLINLLWFGAILIFVGCVIAFVRRSVDRLLDESTAVHQAKGTRAQRQSSAVPAN